MSFVFSFFPAKHWEWIAILMSLVVLGGMGKLHGRDRRRAHPLRDRRLRRRLLRRRPGRRITFFLALFVILLVRPQGLFGDKIEEA